MTVGLPGAGISAFFYLACALLMPLVAVYRMARGRPVHPGGWPMIARQFLVGVAILAVILLTGWTISTIMDAATAPVDASGQDAIATATAAVGRVAIWIGIGTLLGVLLVVRIAAWWIGRHHARAGIVGDEPGPGDATGV